MKTKLLISLGITLSLFAGLWIWTTTTAVNSGCVTVYVDYGVLKHHETNASCIPVKEEVKAMDALNMAGIATIGTDKYGLQIVCRVNGLPNATPIGIKKHETYIEKCKDMPASFAYWAILVKSASGTWGWAQTGLLDIKLKPGDSIGLVFADNENVRFPN